MGKIGLAISPMKSNVLYAAIELDRRKGAVYKSSNSGGSWVKMSDTVSGVQLDHTTTKSWWPHPINLIKYF